MAVGRPAPLSDRERQVVALLADGRLCKEAALELGLSYESVKGYAKRARQKLGAKNTPQMVAMFVSEDL